MAGEGSVRCDRGLDKGEVRYVRVFVGEWGALRSSMATPIRLACAMASPDQREAASVGRASGLRNADIQSPPAPGQMAGSRSTKLQRASAESLMCLEIRAS